MRNMFIVLIEYRDSTRHWSKYEDLNTAKLVAARYNTELEVQAAIVVDVVAVPHEVT